MDQCVKSLLCPPSPLPTLPLVVTVRKCLAAVRFILPKDTAMKVLVKWYNIYNAPGGPSSHLEWNLFVTCFMTLMGYNTERLEWTRNVSHHHGNVVVIVSHPRVVRE